MLIPRAYVILPPTRKSTFSLWKIITFYPNKQIWPNKLIKLKLMIALNLFKCMWWDYFWEINVLERVGKLNFGQNNKKVGIWFFFQIRENFKAKFL